MNRQVKKEGVLELSGFEIPCYVLDDGTRVLSGRGMQEALKMVDEPEKGSQTPGTRLIRYLTQKSLKPYIYKDRQVDHFEPLICYKGESKINGYEATVLADICDAILEARKNIKLSSRQEKIATQCEILMRGFAKVGIIALVDEATGYQYDRERKELQTILKLFVSNEILAWQQAFHLGFYKEIFRLWSIPFTNQNIKRKPLFVGKLTNELVYKNLPKGTFILDKLKSKTPRTEAGNFKYRLHQSLTQDVGRESLKKVIYSIETLAAISDNKEQFRRLVEDRYGQREIHFAEFWDMVETNNPNKPNKPTAFDNLLTGVLNVPPPTKEK